MPLPCPLCTAELAPVTTVGPEPGWQCTRCRAAIVRCPYCESISRHIHEDGQRCTKRGCPAFGTVWRVCAKCHRAAIPVLGASGPPTCTTPVCMGTLVIECPSCGQFRSETLPVCTTAGCAIAFQAVGPCFFCRKISRLGRNGACANPKCAMKDVPTRDCPVCGEPSIAMRGEATELCRNPHCGQKPAAPAPGATLPVGRTMPEDDDSVPPGIAAPPPPAAPGIDGLLALIARQSHFEERYELHTKLSEGGMGEIWHAQDRLLGREVAIKISKPQFADSPAARGQFVKEAKCGARLLHPHVLPVFDLGVDRQRRIYYAMRYVEGASLRKSLDSVATGCATNLVEFPLERIIGAFFHVCEAIDFAHRQRILHLDLKPDNILISGFSEVFVIDWGLALVDGHDDLKQLVDLYSGRRDTNETAAITRAGGGRALGTPGYMAPEQWEGDVTKFGAPTDVFGLGGILYSILYGTPPCWPPDPVSTGSIALTTMQPQKLGKLRNGVVPRRERLEKGKSDFLGALNRVCLRALERDPQQRYPRVEDMLFDLTDGMKLVER